MTDDRERLARALYAEFAVERKSVKWDKLPMESRDHFRMKAGKITVAMTKEKSNG